MSSWPYNMHSVAAAATASFPHRFRARDRHRQQQRLCLIASNTYKKSIGTSSNLNKHGNNANKIRSIGFSGAGFLGCYHLGVAECLMKHGIILQPGELPTPSTPVLLGASAGSIVSAAVSAGVCPGDDGMNVIYSLRQRVKNQGGILDVLYPGVSLVDHVWEAMIPSMKAATHDGDEEYFMRRIQHGKLLRIALTDRWKFQANPNGANNLLPHDGNNNDKTTKNPIDHISAPAKVVTSKVQQILTNAQGNNRDHQLSDAYCYIDSYRNMHDVITACILSSYIPGLTGPARGIDDEQNQVVRKAMSNVLELMDLDAIKHGRTEMPLSVSDMMPRPASGSNNKNKSMPRVEAFWDGGLSCIWPTIDDSTVIVCPIRANYDPNPAIHPVLNPMTEESSSTPSSKSNDDGSSNRDWGMQWNAKNLFARATYSSSSLARTIPFHGKQVHIGMDNAATFLRMCVSSDESILEERFHHGYNDAKRFLTEKGMIGTVSK